MRMQRKPARKSKAKGKRLPPRQLSFKPSEMVDVINDVLALNIEVVKRLDKLEGRERRSIGFSTDCCAHHDVGDGEGALDYEVGHA
jgi:hypothetical protein